MSNYNIGPRIGIEGEAEFRKQISRINSEYKSMDSYVQSVSKAMEQSGKTQEGLKAKMNGLNQQIKLQEQKYEELEGALKKVREKFGDNSAEAMRYEGAMLDVSNVTSRLKRELGDTGQELWRLSEGIEEVGEDAAEAGTQVLGFGDVLKAGIASGVILDAAERIGEAVLDLGTQAVEAAAGVKAANSQFEQTFGELEQTARRSLESVADDTGIAVTRMQEGYSSLYAFTKSVGGDSETALDIATRAMAAAADSAAYYDRSIEDATETLQSFLKGNYANDAALGIAATETTRNAKANELYAKSFKDLSEAQKVDVLLAMVEAGNEASGALGQAAREADSWTNVTGEAAEAWNQLLAVLGSPILQGLIPLIQGATAAMQGLVATTAADELRNAMEGYENALVQANDALEATRVETDTNAAMAGKYVSKLKELEKTGLKTADAQEEYAMVVQLLSELLPEMNLAIDEQTGRMNTSTDAVLMNVEALKQQAMRQQTMAKYTAMVEAQAAEELALMEAERRLMELRTQAEVLTEQGADANRVYASTAHMVAGEIVTVAGAYTEYDAALANNMAEQKALEEQIAAGTAAVAEHEAGIAALGNALVDMGSAAEDSGGQVADLDGIVADFQKRMDDLTQAYKDAQDAARESLDQQIGLFDELETKSELSTDEIIKNWESQTEAFAKYEDNLEKAVDLGLDEALVKQLSDGSAESIAILNELVNGTETDIGRINAAFSNNLTARDSLSQALANMQSDFESAMDELETEAYNSGVAFSEGVAYGIDAAAWRAEAAAERLAYATLRGYNRTMDINSPSGVMEESGGYTVDGLVNAINAGVGAVERAMAGMGEAGTAALQRQLEAAESLPGSLVSPVSGAVTNNRSVAYGGISININAQPGQDMQAIAGVLLDELTALLGQEEGSLG